MDRAALKKELEPIARSRAALPERVAAVSALFLGTPYKLGPLGEGPKGEFDRDPLARYDEFDCTTLVETTMALALRPADLGKAERLLQRIRYKDGVIDYVHRNHFASVDWIPNNERAGFVRDITRELGGAETKTATKTISKRAWYAAKAEKDLEGRDDLTPEKKTALVAKWRALGEKLPDEQARLDYLPVDALPRLLDKIPSGSIANLVRADDPAKPVLVSHQVFIIEKSGARYVRHAAFGKDVRDVPALEYFKGYDGSKWPLLGLNILAPQQVK